MLKGIPFEFAFQNVYVQLHIGIGRLSSALFTQLHPASKLGDSSELLLVRPLRYRLRNPDESFLQVKNAIFEWKGRQLGEVWDCFCVTPTLMRAIAEVMLSRRTVEL
ncbi:hypothetical protein T01_9845 [Trichinella spiralis]|uniref:Uncharacterized protein n=1 Tax=Trichinella spiralis TaxID=6334 RepID=A0A0V1B437_TRISP|nr:hypothetical protein T01_9845 [Trichinella spiralis]